MLRGFKKFKCPKCGCEECLPKGSWCQILVIKLQFYYSNPKAKFYSLFYQW